MKVTSEFLSTTGNEVVVFNAKHPIRSFLQISPANVVVRVMTDSAGAASPATGGEINFAHASTGLRNKNREVEMDWHAGCLPARSFSISLRQTDIKR